MASVTYSAPPHGWTCFHCGETFTTPGAARDHFGATPENLTGCLIDRVEIERGGQQERGRGLLMALRKAEARADTLAKELEEMKEELQEARGVEGQPRRIAPIGSTATGNEVPVSDSPETPRERRTAFLRRVFEREEVVTFWGSEHRRTPAVVERVIGDGGQLFWFSALNTRPNYYVLQVPSAWVSNDLPEDAVELMEEAVEEEYGNADWDQQEDASAELRPFPAYHDGGCSWGAISLSSFIDEVTEAAEAESRRLTQRLDHLRGLIEKWRSPEFWNSEGSLMDSIDCADELAAALQEPDQ